MVIFKDTDLKFYRSGASGVGNNLGGVVNSQQLSESFHGLFNIVSSTERTLGKTKYRCIYLKNKSSVRCLNPKIYIPQNTTSSGTELYFGFDKVHGVGNGTSSGVADVIADESTAPPNIVFRNGNEVSTGDALGADISKDQMVAIWFKLIIQPNTEKTELDGVPAVMIETSNEKDVEGIVEAPVDSKLAVVGETNTNDLFAKAMERIRLRSIDWLVCTGNASTSTDPVPWFNMLGIFKEKIKLAFGPLDNTNSQLRNKLISLLSPSISNISRGYYTRTRYNICEIVMDVTQPFVNPSPQYDHIKAKLTELKSNPNVDFIVVYCNKAFYATLTTTDTAQKIDSKLRLTYHKLFEDMGVHVVISGQFRNYQRQKVLSWNSAAPDSPGTYTTGAPNYVISTGQKGFGSGIGCLFISNGTSGKRPLHLFATQKSYTTYKSSLTNSLCVGYLTLISQRKRIHPTTGAMISPAKLTGSFYEYYQPTSSSTNKVPQETLKDQWSITIQDPT